VINKGQINKSSINGRITTKVNGQVGIGGAIVILFTNEKMIDNRKTDVYGYYKFNYIAPTTDETKYRIYATLSPFGYNISEPFELQPTKNIIMNIGMVPKPAKITVSLGKDTICADGVDFVSISAYVYDTLGNRLTDNTEVTFKIRKPNCNLEAGSLSINNPDRNQEVTALTKNGIATAFYGWVPKQSPVNSTDIAVKINKSSILTRDTNLSVIIKINIVK
jgi:hypothetical protein